MVGTATDVSLCVGILGTLLFGTGLTCILQFGYLILGIIIAVIATPIVALAYPIYKRILARGKEKYGEEIIRLSNELLGE